MSDIVEGTATQAQSSNDAKLVAAARELADDLFFPNALQTDAAGVVPRAQLDALVEAGFSGVSSDDRPGAAPVSMATMAQVLETLAGGCLTTAFVWAQHLGAARAASTSSGPVRARWSARLAGGDARGGVAFAHILRPGDPLTAATRGDGCWRFNGSAPWVTGWGYIDVMHAAARHGDDIVWALIEAVDSDSLRSIELDLAAVNSSQTVVVVYEDHVVTDDEVTRVEPFAKWKAGYAHGLRMNGSLPLGVASRCCALLGDAGSAYALQLVEARHQLDEADIEAMPAARANAAMLAVRSAAALVANSGGGAITMSHHAQRLAREAHFLLVQGQTPEIRRHLLDGLATPTGKELGT